MKISKKTIIIIAVATAACILAGISTTVVIKLRQPAIPDFDSKTLEDVNQYVHSKAFEKLDWPKKGEVFGKMAISNAKKYYEIPEEERLAYLDKIIDMMEAGKKEFQKRMQEMQANRKDSNTPVGSNDFKPPKDWPTRPPGGRDDWARMGREMGEIISPEDKARMIAFHTAIFMRMQQRGISFMPGPPPKP